MSQRSSDKRRKLRVVALRLLDGVAFHPHLGALPCRNVEIDGRVVGLFFDIVGRFMPADLDGEPLVLTVAQMDSVNKARGLPLEANRRDRGIVPMVEHHEVADLAMGLYIAQVF